MREINNQWVNLMANIYVYIRMKQIKNTLIKKFMKNIKSIYIRNEK